MKATTTTVFKKYLSRVIPNSDKIRYLFYLPKLNVFYRTKAINCQHFTSRVKLYQYVNDTVLQNNSITYCEFGVFKGASLKKWTTLNSDSSSVFYGFDTFTGLPEDWNNFTGGLQKGTFNVDGKFPIINDERVHYFKGIFQDTLPEFILNYHPKNRLVINIDADLYSSTLYVLTKMNDLMKSGTIIIFDEFSSILHEFRALEDYCLAYRRDYQVIAVSKSSTNYLAHVAIELR